MYFVTSYIPNKFQTNMVNVQEMLIEDVKEETKEKIDKENDSPYLTGISRGDEDNMTK
jgi:hypothetical protein